ncbi:MAG: bifunctional 5,10-methylenetetrahydrofolate dehydrogenase/5,10-methenyltetrahydrofolate cyclohydrolase [Simkaniaceae bacterium]|nr:bifunctional 5,10-methylenetetrahydrofolate dehydrogenase/5,10-methenyltetrahydrofolate cyclohydrolase [Simkaniaceae bacterium]
MKLIDGTLVASRLVEKIKHEVARLPSQPGLACILVGNHSASHTYVKMKQKRCQDVGIYSEVHPLPDTTSKEHLIQLIESLNQRDDIDGILIQQPLIHTDLMEVVSPKKDVDGFHPLNMGKLLLGHEDGFIPCTPLGIVALLEAYQIPTEGKRVLIIGRSNIVGKPLAALLMNRRYNATVTLAHSKTKELHLLSQEADILIAAMGAPRQIQRNMVKKGAVVIDVGITRLDGHLVGDVDFEGMSHHVSAITPVPGGVGPMTIAMLLANTLLSYQRWR